MKLNLTIIISIFFSSYSLGADLPKKSIVTPIFSQLVMFSYPEGFTPVLENTSGSHYIQESVLKGESVKAWSEMITITGLKGLASELDLSPINISNNMALGFKKDCPTTFNAVASESFKVSGYDAFFSIMGCGIALPTGEPYSELMLLFTIKGKNDYYTIQWAERGKPLNSPPNLIDEKWTERLKKLLPLKVCDIIPNEPPPYQSCIDKK